MPFETSPAPGAPLLQVRDLAVEFQTIDGSVRAVEGVDLDLAAGETVAIVGESGSGKSTTAMAVIGLLAGNGRVAQGSIRLDGQELVGASESTMRGIRGAQIGLVPQDPMSNLNPTSKIGTQVAETLLAHGLATRKDVDRKVVETLAAAGLPNAEDRAKQYPHEFSGGMRQRALIAIGLACNPRLLIADEPTSALDVTVQKTILDQLGRMTTELGTSVLLITHDLGLAAERAARVVVMHRGRIVEQGPARQILEDPQHPYTQSLVQAAPSVAVARLRPEAFTEPTPDAAPKPVDNIVEVEGLTKLYNVRGQKEDFAAVKDVSFSIPRGETVAIVGESGSGKTTTARMLLKVVDPTEGVIRYDGTDVASLKGRQLREFRQKVQPIFQDPYSSLNPMFTIERIVQEPLDFYNRGSAKDRAARVRKLLDDVALPASMLRRYPSELSGGQRQRVAIARALALSPELIVCDEPVSALDVLVQDQILTLLRDLQTEYGLSYLFISHDLAVVRLISDYVCVMKDGALVEAASSEEIFTNPRDPYTRNLLSSIPGNELDIAV
ncbi:peptide/nickel transport system ATP-binding protein [Microbacterium sp. LKL04]|uniref:ABC transporter ATP-binding protein n=1 Tax=unclassified Microbacterium TaxID=2609290 RepID=UPI000875EAAC|nr:MULTISPECIES: ABC transporter ATP-binding protein [unclassified Microbacterium]MDQ1126401.1 peptide/nickel transport system ATP-binding protein [Microbacterium sp. SORGH_AS_0505]SCY67089.1 peptide/nickel transport system ATP-binding protein [Microbacterium sp. LKL04]